MNIPDYDWIDSFISEALAEDTGDGDHTSNACISEDARATARLIFKDHGMVAGVELAQKIFLSLDPSAEIKIHIEDGTDVEYGEEVFEVTCNTRALLRAERLVLNCMQRMSAIATLASRFDIEVEGTKATILDTRKTTPLIRMLEKWAVKIGGASNYRFGLFDMIMIKDNHVDVSGGIRTALERVKSYQEENNLNLKITLEIRNLVELYEALEVGGFDRLMLDNFELPILTEAVAIINQRYETEASGGIKLSNVRKVADTGVDFISVGALTHSAGSLDMSLKIML
jgi:nicotinate-nucleotide pyrophosphorylase (carboxylating)